MVYSKKISLKFQDGILEQAKVTEQDYVLQFLKKLKLRQISSKNNMLSILNQIYFSSYITIT